MKIRLVVSINAAPGKGTELAQAFRQRCADVAKEPGCEQFEVFQSVLTVSYTHLTLPTNREV